MNFIRSNVPAAHAGAASCGHVSWLLLSAVVGCTVSSPTKADDLKAFSGEEKGGNQSLLSDDASRSPFRGLSGLGSSARGEDGLPFLPSSRNMTPDPGMGPEPGSPSRETGRFPMQPDNMGPLNIPSGAAAGRTRAPEPVSDSKADRAANEPPVPIYATLPVRIALASLAGLTLCAAPLVWAATRRAGRKSAPGSPVAHDVPGQ
jgi:hypothetical protein